MTEGFYELLRGRGHISHRLPACRPRRGGSWACPGFVKGLALSIHDLTSDDGDDPVGGVGNARSAFSKTLVGARRVSTGSAPSTGGRGVVACRCSKVIGESYARLE